MAHSYTFCGAHGYVSAISYDGSSLDVHDDVLIGGALGSTWYDAAGDCVEWP